MDMGKFLGGRFFVAATAVALLAGCGGGEGGGGGSAGGDGDTFVVGLAAPLTGDSSQFGIQIERGLDLYVEQLNEEGGIDGRRLVLNKQDDAGRVDQAQTVATTLASDESVLAVIGHFNSSCSLAGKSIYQSAGVVQFSPGSTNVEVTQGTEFTYRNIFTDEFQGVSLATYANNVLERKNAAILYENDDYGTGLKDSFKAEAQRLGMNIVVEQAYDRNAPDFRSQVQVVQSQQPAPDVLLIAGLYTQAANIARQARGMGLDVQIIGGDGVFSQQFIDLGGEAVEGSIVSCPFLFDLGGERAQQFAAAYREKYGEEPDAWAALSYDALDILCEGFRRNGFSREAVLEYLKTLDSPENAHAGVVGETFFDEDGDSKRPVQMAQVKDGKFVAADMQLSPDGQPVPAGEVSGGDADAGDAGAEGTVEAEAGVEATPSPTATPISDAGPDGVTDGAQDVPPPPVVEPRVTPEAAPVGDDGDDVETTGAV